MAKLIRVLCVHGVNVDEKDSNWQPGWTQAIGIGFNHAGSQIHVESYLRQNALRDLFPVR